MLSNDETCYWNNYGIGSIIRFWRRIFLLTGLLLFIFMGKAVASDKEPFLGFYAEYYYRTAYPDLKGHKAFAIGPQSVYGYSWGVRSSKDAANSALKSCNNLVARQKKHGVSGKCQLHAVDDKVVAKNPQIGLPWHEPSPGEDIPLRKGAKSFHIGNAPRGVVLQLHGCDGMGWNRYAEIWGSYFTALGYDFFAPDSFAEPRPSEVCGSAAIKRAKDQTIIMKLRVAQTLRSIAELKKKYPGVPIYVWGHSEGGSVVKFLNVDVAGLISSGDECDANGLKIAAPASVPVLYLLGEYDPNVEGSKLPLKEKEMRKCRNYVRNEKTKVVIIKNSKHDIWPWRPEVSKAMSEFIGAKPFNLAQSRPAKKLVLSENQISAKNAYQKNRGHKAFAASSNGSFSWVAEWEFAEDAQQFTLYDCARYEHMNVFKLSEHVCSVIDTDGKNMMAQ